jgi:hypothetical protein
MNKKPSGRCQENIHVVKNLYCLTCVKDIYYATHTLRCINSGYWLQQTRNMNNSATAFFFKKTLIWGHFIM